jgi:low temperature requirement protein LtrA
MGLTDKINGQKGESTTYYVVLGFLIAVGLFVAVKYFHDRDNDITVHLPKVEVH